MFGNLVLYVKADDFNENISFTNLPIDHVEFRLTLERSSQENI